MYYAFRLALLISGLAVAATPPLFADVPNVPANFSASTPLVGTDEVTWNEVAGVTFYELGWGNSAITTTISLPANTSSYTFSGLSAGISYHFRLRACNPEGCSAFTPEIGATPNGSNGLPGAPANFVAATTQAGTDILMWDDVTNETSYELGWGDSAITTTIPLPANTLFHIFPGLGAGISYHFRLRACNAAGCGPFTPEIGATPNGSNTCSLSQNAWFATTAATLSFILAANVPTTWRVWAVGSFGVIEMVSFPLPAVPPIATGDFSFTFPAVGVGGFLSALTTATGGLLCSDFDKVNTGPGPASVP